MKSLPVFFFILMLACTSCETCKHEEIIKDPIPVSEVSKISEMNLAFGWNMFQKEFAAKPRENVLISPYSIQTALTMVANGTQNNTLSEILSTLQCENCNIEDINVQHTKLNKMLTEQSGSAKVTVRNSLFSDPKRVEIFPAFDSTLRTHYNAEIKTDNFNNTNAALANINGWVNQATQGKIPSILEQISPDDIAFLINALYFKADWKEAFPKESTSKRDFTNAKGQKENVDFVNNDNEYLIATKGDLSMVDLPFRDSTYSFTLVQSTKVTQTDNWVTQLNGNTMQEMYQKLQLQRADLSFPKLKLSYDNDLIQSLEALGIRDAFSPAAADLSKFGRAARRPYVNQIRHKAVLEVDEKGAEGAAVTSIGIGVTSLPQSITYDRPFVLALRHVPTGTLMFIGYVATTK